jgi:hypothetical protein
MSDPLDDARAGGVCAGFSILDDFNRSGDVDECIRQVRLAAQNDTKYNWHLIETIVSMARIGLVTSRQKASDSD